MPLSAGRLLPVRTPWSGQNRLRQWNKMKKVGINLEQNKSEAEWIAAFDRFYDAATPLWFTWLGWAAILGVIHFVVEKTNSIGIRVVWGISWWLFLMYFINFFYRFELENLPWVKSAPLARLISILASGLLGGAVHLLLWSIVTEIGSK